MQITTHNNPLVDFTDLPHYADIESEHIEPALEYLLSEANRALETAVAQETDTTWFNLAKVLDTATEKLGRAWGVVSHLKAVKDSPQIREAYSAMLGKVTEFWTHLGQDERLYAKYKTIRNDKAYEQMNSAQKRALDLTLQGFILSGAELQGKQKERFAEIQERQAELSQRFSENLLDATDNWELYISENDIQGIPADIVIALQNSAKEKGKDGFRLTLQPPIYIAVMQYAEKRELRETLYKAYVTRASEFGDEKLNNDSVINEILKLRQEEASLLSYKSYAEVSLKPKMAQSPAQVIDFLKELAQKATPYAQKDLEALKSFAKQKLQLDALCAWDIAYVSEKLKEEEYAYSEQDVKAYFTQPKVIAGLFNLAEKLFNISITEDNSPATKQVWDSEVKLYRIERSGTMIGQFYTDLRARTGKRSGAWMDDVRARWLRPDTGKLQTPVAQLVCNFAGGIDGKPALLTHDDVQTLFHEFGHGLHHLLSQVTEKDVSGISGVEWDAVELPSQFMENFCWEWAVLEQISAHVETGKPLPRSLYEKMHAAKNFQSGLQTLRQIEFALFDMLLHSSYNSSQQSVQALLDDIRQNIAILIPPSYNRFQNSFSHIFAGGYAAGYYSYKWAEVLAADAYAAFEEAAKESGEIVSPEISHRFREEILEIGGSRPALESFKAFRGREPDINALLRHQGMAQ